MYEGLEDTRCCRPAEAEMLISISISLLFAINYCSPGVVTSTGAESDESSIVIVIDVYLYCY